VQVGNGITIRYSNVNQAYFVMWHNQVLRVFNRYADAERYADEIAGNKSLQENPSALPWIIGGGLLAAGIWWWMSRDTEAKAETPSALPCPITDAMLTTYVKSKPTTYKLYVPPDKTQPVAQWPAPKADYVSNKNAHTFSTVDCGFYKWNGTKWVSDDAENAALAKFVGASVTKGTPALNGHPADFFMV